MIVATWILNFIKTSFYPQTKIIALEMIHKISVNLPLTMRVKMILPYLSNILTEEHTLRSGNVTTSRVMIKTIDV